MLGMLGGACAGRPGPPPLQPKPNLLDRPHGFYGHGDVGLGMPEGLVGAGVGFAPVSWAALELGGGLSTSGPQGAAIVSLRGRVSEPATLGVGTGVSIGPYVDVEPDADDLFDEDPDAFRKTWHWVVWSNTEVQVRHALSESVALRGHLGITFPASESATECKGQEGMLIEGGCPESTLPELLPYLGFGVEVAF